MKKTVLALSLLFISALAYAQDSDVWKYNHLEEERARLSAEYEGKAKELAELTTRIHDIETQLGELKLKVKESHTRAVSNLPGKY